MVLRRSDVCSNRIPMEICRVISIMFRSKSNQCSLTTLTTSIRIQLLYVRQSLIVLSDISDSRSQLDRCKHSSYIDRFVFTFLNWHDYCTQSVLIPTAKIVLSKYVNPLIFYLLLSYSEH